MDLYDAISTLKTAAEQYAEYLEDIDDVSNPVIQEIDEASLLVDQFQYLIRNGVAV